MSQLYIIQDLSPALSWVNNLLHKNIALLEDAAIALAPVNPWTCQLIPSHIQYWRIFKEGATLPQTTQMYWQKLADSLDNGRNTVLLAPFILPGRHRTFARLLKQKINPARHELKVLTIIGRPSLRLEHRFREGIEEPTLENIRIYMKSLASPAALLDSMREDFGRENFSILINPQSSGAGCENAGLASGVFSFLGIADPPKIPRKLPLHPLFFASDTARRLSKTLEVRYNAWPPLDENACYDALKQADSAWPEEYILPLSIRREFAAMTRDETRRLEEIAGVAEDCLAAPECFLSGPDADLAGPLPKERLAEFLDILPDAEKKAIHSRLSADYVILNADQKSLYDSLRQKSGFRHIGEVNPPVELTVLTMTYNQEKYIAGCMDSVLAQKTDFPVKHIVLDHHSSDATPKIVAQYAARHPSIQAVLLSQRAPAENVTGLFSRCRSKYAALCDGDDYFTEPAKLQKQVDFLEANTECALCFHPVLATFEDGRPPGFFPPLSSLPQRSKKQFYLADLTKGNFIQTNSVVYRWRFRDGLPDWFRPDLCPGDWYWHMLHAETGKIGFIPEAMSIYRRHSGALYAAVFDSSALELRRTQGMAELETYKACNDHFQGRYFRSFSLLAAAVFADFFNISIKDGDDSLLKQASDKYPEFALEFFKALKQDLPGSQHKK